MTAAKVDGKMISVFGGSQRRSERYIWEPWLSACAETLVVEPKPLECLPLLETRSEAVAAMIIGTSAETR